MNHLQPQTFRFSFALALLLLAASQAPAQEEAALPEGEGKALVGMICSQCHGLKPLFVYRGDDHRWEILVHEMVAFGAQVSPQERDTILAYLKASFSTDRGAGAGGESTLLPPGQGKELVQASCASCHGVPLIARKRADRAEWNAILRRHTGEGRVNLSAEQAETLLGYLTTNFGKLPDGAQALGKQPK
jgi:mono/diheme cytochrome c family protein